MAAASGRHDRRGRVANLPENAAMDMNPWYRSTWLLLTLLALLTVVFPVLDVAGILRTGIPSDHAAAFRTLAGQDFADIRSTGVARYLQQLEYG